MNNRCGRIIAALALPLTLLASCSRPAPEPAPPPALPETPAVAMIVPTATLPVDAPRRLVRELLAQQAPPETGRFPVQLPENAAPDGDTLTIPVELDAGQFNTLGIEFSSTSGSTWGVDWISDRKPAFLSGPLLRAPLFPDGQTHRYTLDLEPFAEVRWAGRITALRFWLGDQAQTSVLRGIEFVQAPRRAPRRMPIENQTLEALAGPQAPWNVPVPEHGVFEAHVGMASGDAGTASDGARFIVRIGEGENARTVAEKHMMPYAAGTQPDWEMLRVDLSEYAGQETTLQLDVDYGATVTGDFPFWGDPMVYSAQSAKDFVPVVLISLDTLRADHLSCYGHARATTPHLDAFAREAVLFEHAVTPESWTLTAHVSMMTGLHPRTHGVTPSVNLPESFTTLGEALTNAGYLAGGFTGHGAWVAPWRGIGHGFDVYNLPPMVDGRYRFRNIFDTTQAALGWISGHRDAPLFLFFHSYDIHSKPAEPAFRLPYEIPEAADFAQFSAGASPPAAFTREGLGPMHGRAFIDAHNGGALRATEAETQYLKLLYDDGVRVVDREIQTLFDALKEQGLYDNALIIVTSDHGEGFNEHGTFDHVNMFEENAHVPLLIRFPGGAGGGRRVAGLVSLMDIFPTVLEALGIPIPPETEGRSLLALARGTRSADERVFGRREQYRTVFQPPWKLVNDITMRQFQLFNLAEDPHETADVLAAEPQLGGELKQTLQDFFNSGYDGGWTLALRGGAAPAKVELTCISESGFAFAALLEGDTWYWENVDTLELSADEKVLRVQAMTRPQDVDVLRFLPASGGTVQIMIESSAAVQVTTGRETQTLSGKLTLLLDPKEERFGATAEEAATADEAVLGISYAAPLHAPEAAKPMTPEEQAELGALGYF